MNHAVIFTAAPGGLVILPGDALAPLGLPRGCLLTLDLPDAPRPTTGLPEGLLVAVRIGRGEVPTYLGRRSVFALALLAWEAGSPMAFLPDGSAWLRPREVAGIVTGAFALRPYRIIIPSRPEGLTVQALHTLTAA